MRVSLARALYLEPTLLLLDEPTNHLDLNAVIWLDNYLSNWKKMLLVVSHDQDFLNSVCTDVIHLEDKKLYYYRGNYFDFKKMHEQKVQEQQKLYEKQQKQLKALKAAGHSSKDALEKAKKLREAQAGKSAKKASKAAAETGDEGSGSSAAARLDLVERPRDYVVNFVFPSPPPLSGPVIEVIDAFFHYPNLPNLFENVNMGVTMETRMCIVGPNGVGKSTLLNLITGDLEPTEGEIRRNRKLRIGRYNQHFVDILPMEITPTEYLQNTFNQPYEKCRAQLGKFGLVGYAHVIPIRDLSGGQKARVVFAALYFLEPHILFLDEPTNHLDVESIDALVEAINNFKGGVVIVSHDARLITETNCDLWVCDNKDCTAFEGEFEDYRDRILEELEEAERAE